MELLLSEYSTPEILVECNIIREFWRFKDKAIFFLLYVLTHIKFKIALVFPCIKR